MIKIGTRDSQLAVWQASLVKDSLAKAGISSELVFIKSDGDIDLVTPLYALGVQGVFTRTLDAALLSGKIDIAVHSMKDVPTQLAQGIVQAAVLPRASWHDVFVPKDDTAFLNDFQAYETIATSSVRRKAQWLRRFPNHTIENIRGNVNTRLRKVQENEWKGALFAAAGLERIGLLPENAIALDWMLPAPAQGAIMVVCREGDVATLASCRPLHDDLTGQCVKVERDFLQKLMGGCTAPISALALPKNGYIHFRGHVLSLDGKRIFEAEEVFNVKDSDGKGFEIAEKLIQQGAGELIREIREALG
ncbi:MAG: hydroxymethylbilane synthase [Chitinophagaceae bacterium]|nr:hydroxymethylbilane synthase [Chitinophagaceae bacterium]